MSASPLPWMKLIAKEAARVFGGRPSVCRHTWTHPNFALDVMTCSETPACGVNSFSTIGLSQFARVATKVGKPIGVELVAACSNKDEFYSEAIALVGRSIAEDAVDCRPSSVVEGCFHAYAELPVTSAVLVDPFLWNEQLNSVETDDHVATWLQVVPITAAELQFQRRHGSEALLRRFQEEQIDVFDLRRTTVC